MGGHTIYRESRGVWRYPLRPVGLVVQKFGGTSVADSDRIRAVADHVARTHRRGNQVVVVVSAMGKSTDDLIRLAGEVAEQGDGREMDVLLTAGERISMALVAMAITSLGVEAASFTGSQAGILTDTHHGKAKILEIRPDRLQETLAAGKVAVVAGFQGVSTDRDITTLGRGGSDTTAVALAAALGADVCEIYTDVSGVYTADPRIVPAAHKLDRISFEEMLEMAATGGRVLALRSVEFARNHHVPLHVRSSFSWEPGTWVTEEDSAMEEAIISAVTDDPTQAKVTVLGVPDQPGIAARLFETLAAGSVNLDMIVQNVSSHGHADISFTVAETDLEHALDVARTIGGELGASEVSADRDIVAVSVVGAGMKTNPGVAAKMFRVLADSGVNLEMISTSTIRITAVIAAEHKERAVQALHTAFGLDR